MGKFLPMAVWAVCLALMTPFIAGIGRTAEIQLLPESSPELPIISLYGRIVAGDEKVFRNIALQLDKAVVVLNSEGGSVIAALEIGKAIRIKEFFTLVTEKGECASACGLIWLGGTKRIAHPQARIGFHAAYITEGGQAKESGAANAIVGAYLNQLGLPQSAILYMTSAPPEGMQYLPLKEAKSLGIDMEVVGGTPVIADTVPAQRPVVPEPPFKKISGFDVFGHDLPGMPIKGQTLGTCELACANEPSCMAYTFNTRFSACFLKSDGSRVFGNPNSTAGYRAQIEAKLRISSITVLESTDLPGGDYGELTVSGFGQCSDLCEQDTKCQAFTFVQKHQKCWLKSSVSTATKNRTAISGVKRQN